MTDPNKAEMSGEARLKARRRKYWTYFAIAMLASVMGGLVSGFSTKLYENGIIPVWMPIVAIVAVFSALAWACWDYFKRIDEIDLMDNLWAHTIGFYVGIIAFGVWFLIADLGVVPSPPGIAIAAIMLVATGIAYGLRKLNIR